MVQFSSVWRRWSHEKLPQSDEEFLRNRRDANTRGRHEISWALTGINLFLTILTITIVSLPEKPQKYLVSTASAQSQCDCDIPAVDRRYKNPHINPELKKVSGYSPVLDEVDLTPQPKVLNGHFHDNSTIFMQDPSPEVDEAWSFFSDDIFLTTYPTVRDAGRSLSKSIHFPPSPNGEPGKYLATWDVFHQIHCLNWLRKATNWDYYYGDHKPGPVYASHQKHCIHMLLQSLMCSSDVDMITFEWMEGHDSRVDGIGKENEVEVGDDNSILKRASATGEGSKQDAIPAANFHVHKMCRNFDALVEWAKKNKEEDPSEVRRKLTVPENAQLSKWKDY